MIQLGGKEDDKESQFFELRALRNRARKRRANKEFEQAKKLYSQALDVAMELKSPEEVEKIEKIISKIALDHLLQRLEQIEGNLMTNEQTL